MAFLKYARAAVVHPQITRDQWLGFRTASRTFNRKLRLASAPIDLSDNLVERAAALLDRPFSPKNYLMTHATIVASVDTYKPSGFKLGKVREKGFQVNRKYSDFRVTPETQKYINDNVDCWSRGVIAKSFKTFVGGFNFVEHVQVEELSKGRIIDAVCRDIGESLYVDILIATDRKHRDLIAAIQNGKMSTLSMGCTVDGTICTRCGHWASDETEMCHHVKYSKGNVFFDEQGQKHIVAELCGHASLDPTGGVRFIEGSWVGHPAFKGAVLRNILEPTEAMVRKAREVLQTPPPQWSKKSRQKRGSIFSMTGLQPMAAEWDEAPEEGPKEEEKKPDNPLQSIEDELTQALYEKVKKRVEDSIKGPEPKRPTESSSLDDNIQRQARRYKKAVQVLARTATSDAQLVDRLAGYHESMGYNIPVSVYRSALRVGGLHGYSSKKEFLTTCGKVLGRKPTKVEVGTFLTVGMLLSQVGRGSGSRPSAELGNE